LRDITIFAFRAELCAVRRRQAEGSAKIPPKGSAS
jgi:hypothetical protein